MDTSAFRIKSRLLVEALDPATASWWENALGSDSAGTRILRDAISRVVLLIGDADIKLVDGKLSDEDGAAGFLHVVTADRLIRAVFSATRENGQSAETLSVESVPLSAVRSVRVKEVGTSRQDDAAWPSRVRIRLILDRDLAGETEIELPETVAAAQHHAAALAVLAQRLPL